MSEPKRTGLLQLLRESQGAQFVIPVYQRSYTWSAEGEVKQYLADLNKVLVGDYKNHFMGIIIYLEKNIDFSTREFSIIDGQQRLTTSFLAIYAIKKLLKEAGKADLVHQLEGQYLTNPFGNDKIKYKLKPLVADDDVYKCIVEERMDDIDNPNSNVLKNYNYIYSRFNELLQKGYIENDILMAMDKLYVVCVPISEEDNAQKIFESINATGVKLTSADLIRNYLLMDLQSDIQEKYYANYWKKIEDNVSADSKMLEMFFRLYMAIKKYELAPKTSVYREFVNWTEQQQLDVKNLFDDLMVYAKIFHTLMNEKINSVDRQLRDVLVDFRKINSDIPLTLIMESYRLFSDQKLDVVTLKEIIHIVNGYMLRRSICDLNSQNISKLFPTVLKKVLEKCQGDYSNVIGILNQELIGNNANTSGSYMPTDKQMHELLYTASVYKRPALRIILDRIELHDNPAPVDLSALSVEHLMPQTATEEWLEELDTDMETYQENIHRIGNLTLAAKHDNSKMSNLQWGFKNAILENTGHLKMNEEILKVAQWNLEEINKRTTQMINRICEIYPYPDVVASKGDADCVDENTALDMCVKYGVGNEDIEAVKKRRAYKKKDNSMGYIIVVSKMYLQGDKEKYWFGYREKRFDQVSECQDYSLVLGCRNEKTLVVRFPKAFIESHLNELNNSIDAEGNIKHYHIVIFKNTDGKVTMLLSKPDIQEIDISEYVVGEE